MYKAYITLILLTLGTYGFAADVQVPDSYQGQKITPQSLFDLTPQVPEEVQVRLTQWISEPKTTKLLNQLIPFNRFPNWRGQMQLNTRVLQAAGDRNTSQLNYVLKIPTMDYMVKISGPLNRLQSILITKGIWPGQPISAAVARSLKVIPTYQTASRAAYYLILKELIDKKGLKHISVPETHLVFAPHAPEKDIQDEYVFILQKAIPQSAKKINSTLAKNLSKNAIQDLVEAIIGAGLWNINNNIFVDNNNKMHIIIHLTDFEQPNNSHPDNFFHKDKGRYYGNARAGLEELLNLFQGNDEQLIYIKELIEDHPVFKSGDFPPRHKQELVNILKQKVPQPEDEIE
ncbi:MAG: hypothetical protein WD055_03310 [Candidatus Dependentiae bacterium]